MTKVIKWEVRLDKSSIHTYLKSIIVGAEEEDIVISFTEDYEDSSYYLVTIKKNIN